VFINNYLEFQAIGIQKDLENDEKLSALQSILYRKVCDLNEKTWLMLDKNTIANFYGEKLPLIK
jgi:hypothetical protein